MGLETSFHAAHRLHSPRLSDERNLEIYDKCNNPAGHGHLYRLETTIGGKLDEHSGTLYALDRALESIENVVSPWKYKHLDLDTDDFTDKPSTAENMISILYSRLNEPFGERLNRVRLWETPNNRFTIRRD
jgi:6-pyruvoyltetrahydropterin/6-carboxytetrahydropterin synthase